MHKNLKYFLFFEEKGCNFVTFWYNKTIKGYKIVTISEGEFLWVM